MRNAGIETDRSLSGNRLQSIVSDLIMTTLADTAHLSRLRWHCRRGMRELDVLLMRYVERDYAQAGAVRQQAFEALLELQDPVILAYLTGAQVPDREDFVDVIRQLTRTGA